MKIKKLEWDSTFFGMTIGSLEISDSEPFDEVEFLDGAREFTLVYIFSTRTLKSSALTQVDTKVVFGKAILALTAPPPVVSCYRKEIHSLTQLEDLALQSGEYSRFKTDGHFPSSDFQRLYKHWLTASLEHRIAFETLVYAENGDVDGFVTVGEKDARTASIGLIAVRRQRRGSGVGRMLMQAAEELAHTKGYTTMHAATQLNNTQAYSFYLKNGYSVHSNTNVYHYWRL